VSKVKTTFYISFYLLTCLLDEVESSHSEYISKQTEDLQKKLASTESIQKEVNRTKEALKDR
jgi:hypothetical protein